MDGKKEELVELKKLIKDKMSEEEKNFAMGRIASSLLSTLASRLIKDTGYSVASKVLQREIRDVGKRNVNEIMNTFGLKENTPENASKTLKIAALILGLDLDVKDGETIVRKCPQASLAKELKEPFLCNICHEYSKGVVEGMVGDKGKLEVVKNMGDGDEYCEFYIKKLD